MKRTWLCVALVASAGAASADPDPWAGGGSADRRSELRGPDPEVGTKLGSGIPAVPAFELPVMPAGTHGVRELAAQGRPLLAREIRVSGYVLWIYDCATAIRRPKETAAQVQKRIDDDPTLCERKKVYLGDAKDTPPERGLWVVDVPRPPNKLEKTRLPKEDLAAWPKVPALAVGDYVTVTGTFALASPHSERNSDGLLVWKDFVPATPGPVTMAPVQSAPRKLAPLVVKAVARPPKDLATRGSSVKASNEGTKAYGQKQYDTAIAHYGEAVRLWDGNHVGWYGMAGAMIGKGDWAGAEDAMKQAFEVAPDQPMYVMVYGYAVYNNAIETWRVAQARRQNVKPEDVAVDLHGASFDHAEQLLRHAVSLDDQLWRAHYYLGRILRDTDRPQAAAEELTKALSRAPTDAAPWIALAELYRRWQRPDLGALVAAQGTLTASADLADVWFELGMCHDDVRADAKAIEAFTKVLDDKPDHRKARFQRGQAYFRTGDRKNAKQDLEAFVKASGPGLDFARQEATKMLLDLEARRR